MCELLFNPFPIRCRVHYGILAFGRSSQENRFACRERQHLVNRRGRAGTAAGVAGATGCRCSGSGGAAPCCGSRFDQPPGCCSHPPGRRRGARRWGQWRGLDPRTCRADLGMLSKTLLPGVMYHFKKLNCSSKDSYDCSRFRHLDQPFWRGCAILVVSLWLRPLLNVLHPGSIQ